MSEKENKDKIYRQVQSDYAAVACGCSSGASSCCSGSSINLNSLGQQLGYSSSDLENTPEGANLGLGCGNPQTIAGLAEGEVVLDLGSGGGFDCFLAADKVGKNGRVIGVDMTAEMIFKARENAKKYNYENVEFRLGEIENLPVADNSIDVIISNCVINLSPDKQQVFTEAYRVLKNKGRLAISDVVLLQELPVAIKEEFSYYSTCVSGASYIDDIKKMLKAADFKMIKITAHEASKEFIKNWAPQWNIQDYIVSASIEAIK